MIDKWIVAKRIARPIAALGLLFLCSVSTAYSYSILTHEAIIDSSWDGTISPLLLKRFPAATPDELTQAHAYAYGGSIIQDLGYYPFGSKFYSDLTHYVRSGDFIVNMIRSSEDLNEYAFSLGALSHYAADNNGHSMATNASVPLLYPALRLKFGNRITYADDPFSHSKTEFSFDVFQAAKGRYASDAYKAFIGFEVAKPVLERAFLETYGMPIEKVFLNLDLALGSYRRAVGSVLPAMTRIAWQIHKHDILRDDPGITRRKFLYNLSRSSYEKNWGSTYTKPTRRSQVMAFVFRIVPKIGPFKPLAYKPVTPEIEKLYMASVNATIDRYVKLLAEVRSDRLELPNTNFDVGDATVAGKYTLADAAYAKLLHKLNGHYAVMPTDLRVDILAYYHDLSVPISTRTNDGDWERLVSELAQLNAVSLDLAKQLGEPAGRPVSDISSATGSSGQGTERVQ
jgi:hypothetical protein